MNDTNPVPRSVRTMRWVARIWSALISVFALSIFLPDALHLTIAPVDQFLLGLIGLTLLGLLIGWRWELFGGIFAIATMVLREIAWAILKDDWEVGLLLLWFFFLPPAIMYILVWRREKKTQKV